jgi:hypothetical protein
MKFVVMKTLAHKCAVLPCAVFVVCSSYAQKLTIAANFGKTMPVGAFSFHDEAAGVSGFSSQNTSIGTVTLGADLEYRLNERFSMGIAPQFIFNRAKMEQRFSNSGGAVSAIKVVHAYQTTVIPYCVGYHINLFKNKLPIKIVGGISYTHYALAGVSASTESASGFGSGPSGSQVVEVTNFRPSNTLGFILGIDTYPIKDFSRFGFFVRYYGNLSTAAFGTKGQNNGFSESFIVGSNTVTFNQSIGYKPSNLVLGIAYKFNLIKNNKAARANKR